MQYVCGRGEGGGCVGMCVCGRGGRNVVWEGGVKKSCEGENNIQET